MSNPTRNAFSLTGKTILVTGASSGLGQEIALTCARRGARLVISGRDPERLQQTHARLAGDGHVQVQADLTVSEDRERLVQASQRIDGVVHCFGGQMLSPIRQLKEELMTRMYQVHFLAPVMLTQRLLQSNSINAQGSIVFMLSTSAHIGTRGVGPYSAMKSGLLGIIRCLALEQAKHRVRVNGISPSAVPTPRLWGEDDGLNEMLNQQRARHPLGLGTPHDVANATVYLLADASRWVTGTSLVMDGGAVL
ncbi:SDR family NAD(P)-dependent oxidoreductase [Xanthomonas cannabis]|uniref:NAD(P)-dependent dehydrogenase (Short-subunit alcohol dehydrogenase family) n=1 Tax=Xanthomonas cannabis TaxID=1885674 RepID=A0ABR6JMN1_9XANT|nr:SDR family oxidoreductase [Xanthomonas cannabis]MBB4593566.1 NAD(P)-dependent dehydrogenase (short-subunit alcohol dehydrogenase family) [Xanthomonas cannabis]MBB5523221.1 NAD(P)-dependent dehydrogenase (short-subunit alcohol dehydrogenase family) [Xanthomonas cannabis]NIK16830.1 NAD(P)-dependent dehydrogenase (short-subunit alcohol dehydrogenase family) [Xanthomonas cannabis]